MKLLHTADWHLGKAVRGRSRADEHRAVLAEIAGVADQHQVDVVLVVGDVFDTAAPSPESEQIAYQALLDLSHHGERPVVVVTGNHDNPRRLGAVSPVLDLTNVHVASGFRAPTDGGVLRLDVGGVPLEVALVPFLSQRYVVHAADLLELDAAEAGGRYNARVGQLLGGRYRLLGAVGTGGRRCRKRLRDRAPGRAGEVPDRPTAHLHEPQRRSPGRGLQHPDGTPCHLWRWGGRASIGIAGHANTAIVTNPDHARVSLVVDHMMGGMTGSIANIKVSPPNIQGLAALELGDMLGGCGQKLAPQVIHLVAI